MTRRRILSPCPVCGARPDVDTTFAGDGLVMVSCVSRGCPDYLTHGEVFSAATAAEAARLWNEHAEAAP